MSIFAQLIVSAFILVGASFALIGSIGLTRLPDLYCRLHAPTKATTLGVGSTLIGSAIFFTVATEAPSVHEVLVTAFLFLTAPVSAHLVAKSALHLRVPNVSGAPERPNDDAEP
ncbi:MAG: Na+/H+ antiporter subunit G [Labilithrix sp.]|nr:Na+/H+ antiporter subunit G [Labilithrix sp.]